MLGPGLVARERLDQAAQSVGHQHSMRTNDLGLVCVASRHHQGALAMNGRHGRDAGNRADRSVQTQLAQERVSIQIGYGDLLIGDQHRDGNGEIERATGLLHTRRSEVDRDAS